MPIDSPPGLPLDHLPIEQHDAVVKAATHLACRLGSHVFGTQQIPETEADLTRALSGSNNPFVVHATWTIQRGDVRHIAHVYTSVAQLLNAKKEPIATLGPRATLKLEYHGPRNRVEVPIGEFSTSNLLKGFSDDVQEAIDDATATFSGIEGALFTGRVLDLTTRKLRGDQRPAH